MDILILLETADDGLTAEVDAACSPVAGMLGHSVTVMSEKSNASIMRRVAEAGDLHGAVIVTPAPVGAQRRLAQALQDAGVFSVEVQPANIHAADTVETAHPAGADAIIFGLGTWGYTEAIRLISQRERDGK